VSRCAGSVCACDTGKQNWDTLFMRHWGSAQSGWPGVCLAGERRRVEG
jgi:hypothetical protein